MSRLGSKIATNTQLRAWIDEYNAIYAEYLDALRDCGVSFADPNASGKRTEELLGRLRAKGALFRNGCASVSVNGISTACEACTGAPGSRTFFISLRCTRNCYFCFNPNQEGYEYYLAHDRDWRSEFEEIASSGLEMSHIALTGGEPLLHFEETMAFFRESHARWPEAHLRLYTTGDGMTEDMLAQLVKEGLSEVRFSVKIDDGRDVYTRTVETIRMATSFDVLDVMVEMPVVPGTLEEMKGLLLELDAAGVFGINLLEFCFPLSNWDEFERRGLEVKNPPFPVLYNWGYAGGLPIEGSEAECLELLEFAIDEGLSLGVHYCSLENKHRDQVLTQNRMARIEQACYEMDSDDYFFKTLKVFGSDVAFVKAILLERGESRWVFDADDGSLSVHPDLKKLLVSRGLEVATSYNILEERGCGVVLRELTLKLEG